MRTKSVEISALRNPDIHREQIVISWSLNPDQIVQTYEYGTSSLTERFSAAREVIDLGYRVGFHLDPVFYFDGWREAYSNLFEQLKDIPKDRIAFLSIGLFRYMPELGEVIRKRFPFHPVLSGEFFPDEDGKYHYFRPIRKTMYAAFQEWLQPWEGIPILWSMETEERFIAGNVAR
jgi:spore photoproduct lyase